MKMFVVLVRETSEFLGIFSSKENGEEFVQRMEGKFEGKEIYVSEEIIDNFDFYFGPMAANGFGKDPRRAA